MPWHAHLHLQYQRDDLRTVLRHRHQGPLRIFKSLYPEGPGICHNVIIHPPGGLVQGDRLDIDVDVGPDAHGLVSTPGATRFYKSTTGETAEQTVRLALAEGARLEWLPLETIAYPGCHAVNRLEFSLAPGSELMLWDVMSLGLPATGEDFSHGSVTQHLRWSGVWLEHARIDAQDRLLRESPLGLNGNTTLATLVLASANGFDRARREALLQACRTVIDSHPLAAQCGATCPNAQVLVVRALAQQVEPAMQLCKALWATLRHEAWSLDNAPPRIWGV